MIGSADSIAGEIHMMRDPVETTSAAAPSAINNCWATIGVQGDASCVELEQHAHCRNCPVYAAAARMLLDRELPSGYVASWTDHFSEVTEIRESRTRSAIIFRLVTEWFALPTNVFDE